MKILTPLHNLSDIELLTGAGGDEFYMGFSDPAWRETFGMYTDLNRCSLYEEANRAGLEDVTYYADRAHRYGASLYIVMNAPWYGDRELEYLKSYLSVLSGSGVDGIIVSTPEQIELVRSFGLKAVISVMGAVFNSEIARYFRDCGANRIILPRELSTDAIDRIIHEVPDVEYEAFLMRNACRHADCYCLGLHGGVYGGLCYDQSLQDSLLIMREDSTPEERVERKYNNYLYDKVFRSNSCGQCALWRLIRSGVTAVKIVGRMEQAEAIAESVRLTAYNIRAAEESETEADYLLKMAMPEDRYTYCASGMACYYPEIRYR